MKKLLFGLLLLPIFLHAVVDERISDIYFANGVMNTEEDAWKSSDLIKKQMRDEMYNKNTENMAKETDYKLLYNESHGVFWDMLESFQQKKAEHKYMSLELIS